MKKLNAANENLKKFSHVNKKALDQYVSFSEQREAIMARKTEIDAAQTAIKELIEGLDLQKDEVHYCWNWRSRRPAGVLVICLLLGNSGLGAFFPAPYNTFTAVGSCLSLRPHAAFTIVSGCKRE